MDADRKARLGERWICFSCAAKFYDLNKPEPLCPKCGSNQHESPLFKKPKRAKKATKKAARPPAPIEDDYERDVGNSDDDDVDESDDLVSSHPEKLAELLSVWDRLNGEMLEPIQTGRR